MYKVEVDGHTIHDPRDENFILPYAKVDLELNKTGSFEFDITSKNPGYTYVDPMKSIISVYDDGELIFCGRSTTKESDFYNTGTLKCEGELSYLIDTILRPRSSAFNNQTNRYIFQEVLNEHNSQVNEEKKFLPGIIDVDSETISQISFNYEKPLDFISANLIEKYGGYLRIRYADGKRYLDWVKQYGKTSKQPIRFGYNLLDLKKTLTSADVCTVVVPIGGSDKKVTVKNAVVNGNVYGKDYIQNNEAISYFGKIIKVQEFSDIQEPTKLYTEGKKWLEENMKSSLTVELTAIDLHMVDLNIDDFKLGDLVPVISIPHEIIFSDDLPVVEKYSYDLTDPSKNTITVGKTLKVFTERRDKEIYERVQEVKGKFEGYVVTNDGKVEEIKEDIQEYKALVLQDFSAVNGKIENLSGDFASFKTGEFEELKAKQAELESVKGDFAAFKTGEFENLKSKQAEFETTTTQNFTAVNAELEKATGDFASFKTGDFEDLKAKSAELETAVIGKADITDLDALRTRTGTLEADYSKLNTLVNGNLTSENIQNLNLTSLNTTIENGMIKNAMIESLTFDKITGIDINTTKMTVHSDDGKSTWTDNTIQIADANRVRVQIGKDASGDYNIYIWDKDGNLMFDPLYGVQESGIKRAIIRDDMISDDANIQGSKLDIEDVIKEVNGAETVIKGTRIKLDEQNQTLDMAFSSLKTYAEGVNSKTETNTTAITVAQEQISSLISNTTIEKDGETVQLKDSYNNTVSDVNSMKTTIGEHTSLLDEQSGEIIAVQTKANTIESDLNGTKQTISAIQSDLTSTKSRVTTVETGLDGLKTRVSNTETALTKKADGSTVDTLTDRVATCETTLDKFEVSLSETNKTVSDNYTSLADGIEETNATVATHTEQISSHDTRITAAENSIRLKVSTSDFNSYKTTVTGDINTAKNAAINAAASDATTKANNAKSSAISTAAADAKTKADKALADSKSYTNAQVATVNESLSETNQEINVMKGQIALKVEQKDIDTVVQNIDNKFASYSATEEMNSAINMRADSILSTVEETYTTKTDTEEQVNSIKASLELKVNKDTLISEINASADVITLTGNRFVVDSDNFKLTEDGTVTANNVNLTGTFTANSGMVDDATGETVEFNTNVGSKGIILERKSDKSKYTSIDNSSIIIDGGNVDLTIANIYFSPRLQLKYAINGAAYSTNITYSSITLSQNGNENIFAQSDGTIGALRYVFTDDKTASNYITCGEYNNTFNNYYYASGYHAFYSDGVGVAYINNEGIQMNNYDIKFNLGHGIKYGSSEWILRPYTSGDYNVTALGNGNRRTVLYGTQVRLNGATGTTVSSDRRLKKDFADFDERYDKFYMNLKPQMYRMAYTKNSEEYKITNGFIAQDVEDALCNADINPAELDLISCETADKDFLNEMFEGNPPDIEKQYSLNYSGFIALNTYMIQKTRKDLMYQAGRIDLHETIIQDLQNRVYQLQKQLKELKQAAA